MRITADKAARVVLSRAVEPGDPRTAALVAHVGAPQALEVLRRGGRDAPEDVAPRRLEVDPEQDLERAAELGLRFVVPGEPEWPEGIDDLAHGIEVQGLGGVPVGLWVRGPARLDEMAGSVALVGSRSATTYGTDTAVRFAAGAGRAGVPVVSGAAFGIDRAAHEGALAVGARTAAVLACGLDRPYPAAHADLIDRIARTGAVVSELPHGMGPTRVRFLSRNRLIAALTAATVVVEAAVRSGALNTAHWADQLSRAVLGVPGPVTSAASEGVHELLRRGSASVVTRPEHVLEVVGRAGQHLLVDPRAPDRPGDRLTLRQRHLLEAVEPDEPLAVLDLADRVAMPARVAAWELTRLVAAGLVVEAAPGQWIKQPRRRTARE